MGRTACTEPQCLYNRALYLKGKNMVCREQTEGDRASYACKYF